MSKQIEIISIGNELLIGKIANTNASWLADKITKMGGRIRRISVVGDDLSEISSSILEAINRGTGLIITTGGLGPTYDDMTLTGIAKKFDLQMEVNEEALRQIKEKYNERGLEMTPPRKKMAIFPVGSQPIKNPVGTAPGMKLCIQDVIIYTLPGVPTEMESIFDSQISHEIKNYLGAEVFEDGSLKVIGVPESTLAPILDVVRKSNKDVYIKSHPNTSESGQPKIEIHFTCYSNTNDAGKKVKEALFQMAKTIKEKFGVETEITI